MIWFIFTRNSYAKRNLFNLNTLTIRFISPTLLFYLAAAAVVYILDRVYPGGPCTPGLGVLSLFILIPVIAVLLLRNIYLAIKVNKLNFIKVIIHALVIIILVTIVW